MRMMAFHALFPEQAENESLALTPFENSGVPRRPFLFVEAFCADRGCDCRRVMINVIDVERREQVATINHFFESPEDGGQTYLDTLNPQSEMSDALLDLFEKAIADASYRDRLVRHYGMWRSIVDDTSHPGQATLRATTPGFGVLEDAAPKRKVGPNDPCPCGSGRKYKKCCRLLR